MDIIKVLNGDPGDIAHLYNLNNYLADDRKLNFGGNGVNPNNPVDAFNRMMAVKAYYGKEQNRSLVQIIVSYGDKNMTAEKACQYTEQIALYYKEDYQSLWCTHAADHECSQYHTHILLNPVSYKDGRMMNTSLENLRKFEKYVQKVTGNKTDIKFKKKKD